LFFDAAGTSASILFLIVAASAFGMMLTLSGIPGHLGASVAHAGLGLTAYTLGYLAILILLGMVLDSTSILLIMVPLALPAVIELGGNLIWFGIITVIGVEIGLLTPPLGLSVFAIKSSLDDQSISLNDIFIGAIPFTLMMLAVTLCLIAMPGLSLVLL
jgi:C4-dicarboxylate transporter, DctM subunit